MPGMESFTAGMNSMNSILNIMYQQDQAAENRRRWDREMEIRAQEASDNSKIRGMQMKKLEREDKQQQSLDEVHYAVGHIQRLSDALDKSDMNALPAESDEAAQAADAADPYNKLVDEVWNDEKFQSAYKNNPVVRDLVDRSTERAAAYNNTGQLLASIPQNLPEWEKKGFFINDTTTGDWKLVGEPAQQMAEAVWRERKLAGLPIPNVAPGSVYYHSIPGTDKWIMAFKKYGKDGKEVLVQATKDPNQQVEDTDSANHELVSKSFDEMMAETIQKKKMNLAAAAIKARAATGADPAAQRILDEEAGKTIGIERVKAEATPIIDGLRQYLPKDYEGQFAILQAGASSGAISPLEITKSSLDLIKDVTNKNAENTDAIASLKVIKGYMANSKNSELQSLAAAITESAFKKPKSALATIETLRKAIHDTNMEGLKAKSEEAKANRPDKTEAMFNLQTRRDVATRLREAQRGYQAALKSGDPDAINEAVSQIESLNTAGNDYGVTPQPVPSRVFTSAENDQIKAQAIKNLKEQRSGIGKFLGTSPNVIAVNQEIKRLKQTIKPGSIVSDSQTQQPQATAAMADMPPAAQNPGRTIRDTVSGKRYRSNGSGWSEVR